LPIITNVKINPDQISHGQEFKVTVEATDNTGLDSVNLQVLDSTGSTITDNHQICDSNPCVKTFNSSDFIPNGSDQQTIILPSGKYSLRIEAWDSFNPNKNRTSKLVDFEIIDSKTNNVQTTTETTNQ